MTNPISGVSWTNVDLGNGNDEVRISKAEGADGLKGLYEVITHSAGNWLDGGKDHDRDIIEGGADDDVVVARKEDRVVTDRETGVSGQDLVVDVDMQDGMDEVVRNLR